MYGGKNTLIRASVDRREACSPDVILSKNLFFDSLLHIVRRTIYHSAQRYITARRAISYGESHISLKKGSEVALPPLQMVCYSALAAEIAFSVFARMLSIEMVQPAARSASVALPSVRAVEATSSAVLPTT